MYIKLTKNKMARIDLEDYDRLSKYSWHLRGIDGYAATSVTVPGEKYVYRDGKRKKAKQRTLMMHHFILGITCRDDLKGKVIDHINGDKTDNRKCNLRIVSPHRNLQNRTRLNRNNTIGYSNVHFSKRLKKYRWRIQYDNENYYSPYKFTDPKECYDDFIKFLKEKGWRQ